MVAKRSKISTYAMSRGAATPESRREKLIKHLETALQLEHATIPPYFFALCSIKEGTNREAKTLLRAVVTEEMLHMVLVANFINAISKNHIFKMYHKAFMPEYPAYLPNSDKSFQVFLRPFSKEAIQNFRQIERPGKASEPQHDNYASIGQFYAAIKDELDNFCKDYGEDALFVGDEARQIGPEYYYNGGGEIVRVTNKANARFAIKVIVDQGEGFSRSIFSGDHTNFGERRDPAHYFKFNEILKGRYYMPDDCPEGDPTGDKFEVRFDADAVYPARHGVDLNGSDELQRLVDVCNASYWQIIKGCEDAFNGSHDRLSDATCFMKDTKYLVEGLMRVVVDTEGNTVGPGFDFPNN